MVVVDGVSGKVAEERSSQRACFFTLDSTGVRRLKSVQRWRRMTESDRWDLAFAHVPASSDTARNVCTGNDG